MIDWLDQLDKAIFLFLNGLYSDTSDEIWLLITNIPTWIPLYVLIFVLFIKVYKKDSIYLVIALLLVVLVCDQFTSGFMKPFFERPRPCHDALIGHLVHVAGKCGGQFGFASGHSSNSFGIAMFVWLVFKSSWKWTWLMFLWAAVVAYSRIAVGVHYPGDILAGGLLGVLFGYLVFYFTTSIYYRINQHSIIRN